MKGKKLKAKIDDIRAINAISPAFPMQGNADYQRENGLTKREELCARFMAVVIIDYGTSAPSFLEAASTACRAADALLLFWASEQVAKEYDVEDDSAADDGPYGRVK